MTVKCFNRCVAITNTRLLEGTDEYTCLKNCVNTHVETNHRTVKNYTLLQDKYMKKQQEFENNKLKEYVEEGILDKETLELKPIKPKTQTELEVETIEAAMPRLGPLYRWYYEIPKEN